MLGVYTSLSNVHEWMNEKKGKNVRVLASWVYWETLFGYYLFLVYRKVSPFLYMPFYLSTRILTFPRRLLTRFFLFLLLLPLILLSFSCPHNIHCQADFSFYSRQSGLPAFVGKTEVSPEALSFRVSWDWTFSWSHTAVCSQPRMAEKSQPTLIQQIFINFSFSKRLEEGKCATLRDGCVIPDGEIHGYTCMTAQSHAQSPRVAPQPPRPLAEPHSAFLQILLQLLELPRFPPLPTCFDPVLGFLSLFSWVNNPSSFQPPYCDKICIYWYSLLSCHSQFAKS